MEAMCIYRGTYQVSATAVVIKVLVCFIPCAVDLKYSKKESNSGHLYYGHFYEWTRGTGLFSMGSFRT